MKLANVSVPIKFCTLSECNNGLRISNSQKSDSQLLMVTISLLNRGWLLQYDIKINISLYLWI